MPWQRTLYIMIFAQLMSSVGFSIMFPFLPRYVEFLGSSSGMSLELLAALVFSSQALTMTLASPVWGAVSDRFGRKPMVERAAYSGAVMLALMAFAPNAEILVLLRALQGLLTGTVSAGNALVASSVPRERVGYAMGLLQLGLGSGVAVGPFIGGILADAFGYRATFILTAFLLAASGLMVTFGVKETFVRPVRQDKVPRVGMLGGLEAHHAWASGQDALLALVSQLARAQYARTYPATLYRHVATRLVGYQYDDRAHCGNRGGYRDDERHLSGAAR